MNNPTEADIQSAWVALGDENAGLRSPTVVRIAQLVADERARCLEEVISRVKARIIEIKRADTGEAKEEIREFNRELLSIVDEVRSLIGGEVVTPPSPRPTEADKQRASAYVREYCMSQGVNVPEWLCELMANWGADERARCLEEAAREIRAKCTECCGEGIMHVVGNDPDDKGEERECDFCGEAIEVVRSLIGGES